MNAEIEGCQQWILPYHSDQRESTRFDYDVNMVARSTKNPGSAIPGCIIDLSCGGVKAVIAVELPLDETLELEFGLRHTSAFVRLQAVIRWRMGFQYGLEFLYRSESEHQRMRQAFAALRSSVE